MIATSTMAGDVLGPTAAAVSIILAVFAICQAAVLYRWADKARNQAEDAERRLEAQVKLLTGLFERMYADTFTLMRDTVSNMQKEVTWKVRAERGERFVGTVERRTEENTRELRQGALAEVLTAVQGAGATSRDADALRTDLAGVLDRAIAGSRAAEEHAIRATLREALIDRFNALHRRGTINVPASELIEPLLAEFTPPDTLAVLSRLREEGLVKWQGEVLGPESVVTLVAAPTAGHVVSDDSDEPISAPEPVTDALPEAHRYER